MWVNLIATLRSSIKSFSHLSVKKTKKLVFSTPFVLEMKEKEIDREEEKENKW